MALILHEVGPGGPGGRSTRALSVQKLLDLRGRTVLDVGSKEGYNSFDLAECGAASVLGVEVRQSFLDEAEAARRELGYEHVAFRQADVRQIDEMGLPRFDLCLCSGLLYHMQNPFNLLKRLRNVCRHLALETHVAPGLLDYLATRPKYRANLRLRSSVVDLDGTKFRGRLNVFPAEQDMAKTSGSIASHSTFWMFMGELERACALAGYAIEALYYKSPSATLPAIPIDYGVPRAKVFLLARVIDPTVTIPSGPSRVNGRPEVIDA